jgi:RNA polymerase sigma-70 factor, ECF subfamily
VESTGKQPIQLEHPTLSSSLLDGVQQMNADSWSRLVTTFGPIVYGWCRASGIGESDSPDVVQNVFASVASGICSFQPETDRGSFRSWLATITRNKVRDYFRKRARSDVAAGGTTAWQRLQEEPDILESTICPENVRGAINQRVLASVQNEFEAVTWSAFWMIVVECKTAAEVSEAFGVSVASVYQAKSRVLKRLRQRLAETPE